MQTVREFAEEWKVSVRTVRRWIADGTITAKRIGRTVRIVSANAQDVGTKLEEVIRPEPRRRIDRKAVNAYLEKYGQLHRQGGLDRLLASRSASVASKDPCGP